MSETMPVARSPISPASPVMVEQGWEMSARHTDAEPRIMDCTPLSKVLVQASADSAVARALGVPFGRAARDEHGVLVVGSGPGEWLLLAPPGNAPEVAGRVEAVPDDGLVSIVDVTHGRALMRISGARTPDLLAKVCAIDFSEEVIRNPDDHYRESGGRESYPFFPTPEAKRLPTPDSRKADVSNLSPGFGITPDGAAFRSSVAKLVTDVVRDDESGVYSYLLHCERSSGQYLFDALLDAGDEFGIEIDGFAAMGAHE